MALSKIDKIRVKHMAENLMVENLDADRVLSIMKKYFNELDQRVVRIVSREGFYQSFKSDNPLRTAGTYYRNITSVCPEFRRFVCRYLIERFRNMIMEKSKTGIPIRNQDEYRAVMKEFAECFGITPPSSIYVFNSILKDEKSLDIIADDTKYYARITDIFSFLGSSCINDLNRLVLKKLSQKKKAILVEMETAEEKRDFNALLVEKNRINSAIKMVVAAE